MSRHPYLTRLALASLALGAAAPAAAQELVVSPRLAWGGFQLYCPPPSLAQCADPVYLDSACGRAAQAQQGPYPDGTLDCRQQLEQQAWQRVGSLPHAVRLPPPGIDAAPAWTALTPYDGRSQFHQVEGQGAYGDVVQGWQAAAVAEGALPAAVRDALAAEAADGPAFETCEGYVQEKYAPLTAYEVASAPQVLDARAQFNLGLEILREDRLHGSDGRRMPDAAPEAPATPFHAVDVALVAEDDRIAHLARPIAQTPPRPRSLDWHRAASDALRFELDEALEREAELGRAFQRDLRDHAAAAEALAALRIAPYTREGEVCLGSLTDGFDGCTGSLLEPAEHAAALEAATETEAAAREAVVEGLLAAEARGCFEGDGLRCAFAPSVLQDDLAARFDAPREEDYRRCQDLADEVGGLPRLRGQSLDDLNGQARVAGRDWLAAPARLDAFLRQKADNDAARAAEAARVAEAEARARAEALAAMGQLGGGVKRPEQRFHKLSRLGNHSFNLYYEYLLRWRLFDFEQILCNVDAEFEAMFRAGITAFAQSVDVLYARVFANLHRYEGDVRIAGKSVYHDHRDLVSSLQFDIVKPTTKQASVGASGQAWFTVVFVPVKVEGGITGSVGLKYGVKAGVDKGGARPEDCDYVDTWLKADVEPFARVDGFASLAIDIFIARVGVKGTLEVLSAAVPFSARIGLFAPRGDVRALELTCEINADLVLRALSGALALWGELGWCPACLTGETTIFSWRGPSWRHRLFETRLRLPLFGLQQLLTGA